MVELARKIPLARMDSLKSYELMHTVKALAKAAAEVQKTLEMSFLREQVIEVVEGYYAIGKVLDAYEILGGYNNRSFQVIVDQDGVQKEYFLRKYKPSVTERDIRFEHAMIQHIVANGFTLLAGLIPDKTGATFVSPEISNSKFAVYTFLSGEDKYAWDSPIMEESEYVSAAVVLAALHGASNGFDGKGLWREEPRILELLSDLPARFRQCAWEKRNAKMHDYFCKVMPDLLSFLETLKIPEADLQQMVVNPIHCDFHPGNMKFSGGAVVGVFDLDWAKIDYRLFDVCLALVYNSACWGGSNDGNMFLDNCRIFLSSYQGAAVKDKGVDPLNGVELTHFPAMMAMANFYIINWEVMDFYSDNEKNDYEYLAYIKHSTRQMNWIERHWEELASLADAARI